jgi:hypothetical protein
MNNPYGIPDDLYAKMKVELARHPTYAEVNKKYLRSIKSMDYKSSMEYGKEMKRIEQITFNNIVKELDQIARPIQEVLSMMTEKERDETYSMLYGIVLLLDMLESYCASVTENIGKYDKATLGSLDDLRKMGEACGNHVRMMLSNKDYEATTFADFADEVTEFFNLKAMEVYRKVQEKKRLALESGKSC